MCLDSLGCQPSSVARSIAQEMVFPAFRAAPLEQASPMVSALGGPSCARLLAQLGHEHTVHQSTRVDATVWPLAATQLTVAQA